MKTLSKLIIISSILFAASNLYAEAPHGHDHDAPAGGPKGGKLFENTNPQAEFYLEKDRTATITFYDQSLTPVPASTQEVTVIVNIGADKVEVPFEKNGDVLLSKGAFPEGSANPLVVQFKQDAGSKIQNFRFKLDTAICGECKRAEYACICH